MSNYEEFLLSKQQQPIKRGFHVPRETLSSQLHPFQLDIVDWSLRLGKSAIFAAVGLGKTFMQVQWADKVSEQTGKPVLILAPLGVAHQTVNEAKKFGFDVRYAPDQSAVNSTLVISNYDRLSLFDTAEFGGVVLDESSILKNFTGKTKRALFEAFSDTDYKLCCSATPAPNDHMELGNHAEFLDIMPSNEMLMRWFINDLKSAGVYRLKKHGMSDFWRWVTSWGVCMTKPSDLGEGYDDTGYILPKLNIIGHYVPANEQAIKNAQKQGRLMPSTAPSSTELGKVKRLSLDDRVALCVEIVNSLPDDEPVNIWCTLNDEQDALEKAFPDALSVRGSDKPHDKIAKLLAYSNQEKRMIITKPSIAGMGMNWQHSANTIFLGLSFSFEEFHQTLGRNHRYGQTREVNAHVIYSELEGNVIETLNRKRDDFEEMQRAMASAMIEYGLFREEVQMGLKTSQADDMSGDNWTMLLGDCVERTRELDDNSIDFCIHSPPFSNLYIYSDNEADMGNSANDEEFFAHYKFLIKELYRVTAPGRLCAVHCKDLPAYMNRDGYAGLVDFPGEIIRAFSECGWAYHSRVTIWKDPVTEMQRTKNHGLLHKNFVKESNACRQGMPDYIVVFRKYPLDGQVPVTQDRKWGDYIGTNPPDESVLYESIYQNGAVNRSKLSIAVWQRYASPVWFDIDQTKVLNVKLAKGDGDEKHICPLQLDVIARCVDLWTNEGDTVFSPFAGIGSEGYESLKMGRKFIGIELKREYYQHAIRHLQEAEMIANQPRLL